MSDFVELTLYELWRTDHAILLASDPNRSKSKSWVGFDKFESIKEKHDILSTVVVRMQWDAARKAGFLPSEERS